MPKKKKVEEKTKTILSPAETLEVVSSGDVIMSYSKGVTLTSNYNSIRHDIGMTITVPTHEMERGRMALYQFIDRELDLLVNAKSPEPTPADPLDNLGIQVNATMEPVDPAPAPIAGAVEIPPDKSLAETLDDELESLTGNAPVVQEGDIPDEF